MTTMENLKVYKQVCMKIRSTLVSGREDLVSPTLVTRNFVEGFAKCLNDRILPEHSLNSEADESPLGYGEPLYGNGASANAMEHCTVPFCPFIEPAEGWEIEYSETRCELCGSDTLCMCNKSEISLSQYDLRGMEESEYRNHFHGTEHWNYFTDEPNIGPIVMSLKQEPCGEKFRVLVRSSDHYLHGLIPVGQLDVAELSKEEVVSAIGRSMNLRCPFKATQLPHLEQELLKIDETFVKSHHKVGVIRVKPGQVSEEDIFSNEHEPGPFDEFLNLLGQRVKLKGFNRFLGGLDADHNLTGEESVFTEYKDLEIMFHVATLMPTTANDPQQVNKKRHIGNDMICVVFLDNLGAVFNPTWIKSHFIHSYIVIQHIIAAHGQPVYRVAVTSRQSVPSFVPNLQLVPAMPLSKPLRHVILSKLINAERAAYHAPKFLKLTNRSRGQLLLELCASLTEHSMAAKSGRSTRKMSKRSNWLPIGASRPHSPLLDPVREKYTNQDKLVEDFELAFGGPDLADVVFIVGEDKVPLYAIKAILACRSKVFRTMFKENHGIQRVGSPTANRRRLNSGSSGRVNNSVSSPQLQKRSPKTQPSLQRSKLMSTAVLNKMKKSDSQERATSASPEPKVGPAFVMDEPRNIQEQYVVPGFNELVFSEVLSYLMTGACSIQPATVVGITCAAEHFDVPELKQACFDRLTNCLTVNSVCRILTQLERYLTYHCAKTMVVRALEFVDTHANEILACADFLHLSENMVHLILKRNVEVQEILKVRAALAWAEMNIKKGQDFKKVVSPLVKHVRLHLIDANDLMKVVVPAGIFDMDKVMTALAYQVDPSSVNKEDYTMFKPRSKTSVLSSR